MLVFNSLRRQFVRRMIHSSSRCLDHSFEAKPAENPEDVVNITFIDREENKHAIKGKVGDNLMYLAHAYQDKLPAIYLEGACEASLACSTCHVIVEDMKYFNQLPEADEEEEDF